MYTNVNLEAPVGALAFLGTGLILTLAGLLFFYLLVKRKSGPARLTLLAIVGIAAVYVAIMLVFSLASSEKVVARGQEKHFCEIDCHLAYSILDLKQTKTLGNAAALATTDGLYHVITIKTRFDENTITSTRGNGPLTPNSRIVTLVDDRGRRYPPSAKGERALAESEGTGTPLTTPLRPAESYTTTLVFDLPADARNVTLLMTEGEWLTRFLIGHENSLLHKKTRFQLLPSEGDIRDSSISVSLWFMIFRVNSKHEGKADSDHESLPETLLAPDVQIGQHG